MRKLELCSIVSTHFIVEDGAKMFSRLVAMMLMAVVLSTFAMAVEMPEEFPFIFVGLKRQA